MARRAPRVRRENREPPVCRWWFSDAALREAAAGVAVAERERTMTPLTQNDNDNEIMDWRTDDEQEG